VDRAVDNRIRGGWKKFHELRGLLTAKGINAKVNGKLYDSCVRSCMIYACETWAMRKDHESALERAERRMIRWMCGVKRLDKIRVEELNRRLGIVGIMVKVRRSRLGWFGHVERSPEGSWLRKCQEMIVEGKRPRGRPRKTWRDTVEEDLKLWNINKEDAKDRTKWKLAIRCVTANSIN
jgi:hypothetical protein